MTFTQILEGFDQEVLGLEDDAFLTGRDSAILDLSGGEGENLTPRAIKRRYSCTVARDFFEENEMLEDLQETDVDAICEINQEALGYSF